MHTKASLFFIVFTLSAFSLAQEPESIWEKAKRNAAPETLENSDRHSPRNANVPMAPGQVIERSFDPILLKIVVPWGDELPVATIYYRGGEAPYKVGDFVPPFYRLKGITPNMVSLQCMATEDKDKERCVSELGFSGVYQ